MIDATQSTAPPATEFAPPPGLECWTCEPLFLGKGAGIAPNGMPFRTMSCGGMKDEGDPPKHWYVAERAAWEDFNATFAAFAQGKRRCYFRRMPEAIQADAFWFIVARVSFE